MEQELIQDTKETLLTIADILYQGRVSDGIAAMNGVIPNLSLIASGIQDEALQQRLITDALSPILSAMEFSVSLFQALAHLHTLNQQVS